MIKNLIGCSQSLEMQLMQENYSQISQRFSVILQDTLKHGNALNQGLIKIGKVGMTKEKFMDLMDKNINF